jgi:hypothetical protein
MPFSFPPLSVLLTWPAPNYVNPHTRGPENYVISIIFFSLATIAVATRLYTRLYIRRWFGLDDLCICLAYVFEEHYLEITEMLIEVSWLRLGLLRQC